MITIGYPPLQVGGTETYVLGLVEALKEKGFTCEVAYLQACDPGVCSDMDVIERECEGTKVRVVRVNQVKHQLQWLHFNKSLMDRIVQTFLSVVKSSQPTVVHVHPLQLGWESYLIEELRKQEYKVILTHHSSTTSCMRGDLVYLGKEACDGEIIPKRCIKCFFNSKGIPLFLSNILSAIPSSIYKFGYWIFDKLISLLRSWSFGRHLEKCGTAAIGCAPEGKPQPGAAVPHFEHVFNRGVRLVRKIRSFFSIPLLFHERWKAWKRATHSASKIVAVSQWVADVASKNGVPMGKAVLSRHGLRLKPMQIPHGRVSPKVRFGFLGRITTEKGIPTLLAALRQIPPTIDFEFEFCSSTFSKREWLPSERQCIEDVHEMCKHDTRLHVKGSLADGDLPQLLASWDALIVPSFWLESGPMVVYEAFAVQTPVIGSRRGGIQELVEDGRTGFLFKTGDADELAELLKRFAQNPEELRSLRKDIQSPRTFNEVAEDMEKVYQGGNV